MTDRRAARLRARLARMHVPKATTDQQSEASEGEDPRFEMLRRSLADKHRKLTSAQRAEPNKKARDVHARKTFLQEETSDGVAYYRQTSFPLTHRHGEAPIASAMTACSNRLSDLAIDDSMKTTPSAKLVYIDTETTGLAGGAGTLPFLTGLSWFDNDRLHVVQAVLLEPAEERAKLRLVAAHLAQSSGVVSFNGKSFDWPLLRTRFLLGRVACAAPKAHFDLLHVCRRLFREEPGLEDTRLQSLERHVLGFTRVGDLPGAEIPEAYRRFLQTKDVGILEPILEHNLHDLVAMPALLGRCLTRFEERDACADSASVLALAKLCARRGQWTRVLRLAEQAGGVEGSPNARVEAWLLAAWACRKCDDLPRQERELEQAIRIQEADSVWRAEAHLAYAKFLEHTARRYQDALLAARRTSDAEGSEASAHRVARLRQRLVSAGSQRS